jgi:hypothetical protein
VEASSRLIIRGGEEGVSWSCIRGDGKLSVGDVSRFAGGDRNGDMSTNRPSP